MGELSVIMQVQLVAYQNCSRPRTYKPPTSNYVNGGDGVSGNFANIQIDRSFFDGYIQPVENLIGAFILI